MNAKEYASNGEMWTLALALKIAQFKLLQQRLGVTPVVILDDVFAQLDESRRSQILNFASQQEQVLVTVAAKSDIPQFMTAISGVSTEGTLQDRAMSDSNHMQQHVGDTSIHVIDVQHLVDMQHHQDVYDAVDSQTERDL
jgi:DNA replication and repair protein RecF